MEMALPCGLAAGLAMTQFSTNLTLTTLPHLLCLASPQADFMFSEKRGNALLQNTHYKIKGNILSPKSLWRGGEKDRQQLP